MGAPGEIAQALKNLAIPDARKEELRKDQVRLAKWALQTLAQK
jgi:hypothetical protein